MTKILVYIAFINFFRNHFSHLVAVVSAAVNVICELARKNAKNYLPLAPTLYQLLTKSTNNWMLIKIVKLVRFHTQLTFSLSIC